MKIRENQLTNRIGLIRNSEVEYEDKPTSMTVVVLYIPLCLYCVVVG